LKRSPLMPRHRKWSVWLIAGAVWATGVVWLGLHYFWQVRGPFGPEANPAEAWALRAHGAAAFLSLWMLGLLWAVHVTPAWRSGRRRWSGALVLAVALLLTLSGYLLYYVGDEDARAKTSLVHWIVGSCAFLAILLHGLRAQAPPPGDLNPGNQRNE